MIINSKGFAIFTVFALMIFTVVLSDLKESQDERSLIAGNFYTVEKATSLNDMPSMYQVVIANRKYTTTVKTGLVQGEYVKVDSLVDNTIYFTKESDLLDEVMSNSGH